MRVLQRDFIWFEAFFQSSSPIDNSKNKKQNMSAMLPPITAIKFSHINIIKLIYNFLILSIVANQLICFSCLATPIPEITNSGSGKLLFQFIYEHKNKQFKFKFQWIFY